MNTGLTIKIFFVLLAVWEFGNASILSLKSSDARKCLVKWNTWHLLDDESNIDSWKGPGCLKKIIGKFKALDSRYTIGDFKHKVEKKIFKLLAEIYTPTSSGSASGAGIGKRLEGPISVAVGKVLSGTNGRVIGASYYISVDDDYIVFQGEMIAHISCESVDLRYKICEVNGSVTRILSYAENTQSSFCVRRFTFGITNGLLYVTEGCNAKFTLMYIPGCLYRHSRVLFGKMSCLSSSSSTTNTCSIPYGRQITKLILVKQLSDDHCQYRYGISKEKDNKIIVHNGCGGQFIYRYAFKEGQHKQDRLIPNMKRCNHLKNDNINES